MAHVGTLAPGTVKLRARTRNFLIVIIFIATTALVGGWLWYAMRGHAIALAEARERASIITRLAEENMRGTMRTVDLLLEMADRTVGSDDFSKIAGNKAATEQLGLLVSRLPDLRNLWLADRTGRLVFSGSNTIRLGDLAESDFFREQMTRPTPLYIGSLRGESRDSRFIPVSRRIERAGTFSGVLLAAFNPAWFQRFGSSLGLPAKANVSIVTTRGELVTSTSPALTPLDPSMWKGLSGRLGKADSFGTYLLGEQGADNSVLVGYQPLTDMNLVALYMVPYATIIQAWSNQFWFGSAIVALAVVVIIGGTLVMLLYGRRQGDLQRVIGLRTAEAAQAAERLALAVDTTGIGIFDYKAGERGIAWAGVEAGYFGLRPAPILTPRILLRAVHPADRRGLMQRLRSIRTARNDTRFDTEFRLRHPEFGVIWVAARAKLFVRGDGKRRIGRLIGTFRDITERRLLQEHRETVLREINHRIKNSLQLMNSIMNLQSRRIASAEERARFESARRRLISLATVYAHLDDTTRPDVVELVPFLRRLCQDFSVAYMADGRITMSFAASGIASIPATLAVPLGMAMGEILVDVSLDGFGPQATGTVAVNVAIEGDDVTVVVAHDGRGVDSAFAGDAASLGQLLISAFVDQLGGCFSADDASPGTRFTVRFPLPPVAPIRPLLAAAASTSGR